MSSGLLNRFFSDVDNLNEGINPTTESGHRYASLDYEGETHEKLTDEHIKQFSEALKKNNIFKGPLSLRGNDLSDLSALYLSDALK